MSINKYVLCKVSGRLPKEITSTDFTICFDKIFTSCAFGMFFW